MCIYDECKLCGVVIVIRLASSNVRGSIHALPYGQWLLCLPLQSLTGQAWHALPSHADVLFPPPLLQVATFHDCMMSAPEGRQAAIAALQAAVPQHMHMKWADKDSFPSDDAVMANFTLECGLA
jgi:hypothetical protein